MNANPTANPDDLGIETWTRGAGLDENIARKLRDLLFPAIVEAIDWDMLGLARADFVGKAGHIFQQTSISFERQNTKAPAHLQLKLTIVADAKSGQALQGLLRAAKDEFRWNFQGGDRALGAFLDCMEDWVERVASQLRTISAPSPKWNQANAALQLLCVGAAIAGRLKPGATMAEAIDAAFTGWADDPAATALELRNLIRKDSETTRIVDHDCTIPVI